MAEATFEVRKEEEAIIIVPQGNMLDQSMVDLLSRHLSEAHGQDADIIVNMENARFLTSAVLGPLIKYHDR